MNRQDEKLSRRAMLAVTVAGATLPAAIAAPQASEGKRAMLLKSFREVFELSQKEKKGLMVYVQGQTVAGYVINILGDEGVELRSREYGRIVVRMDRIDAVAMN